MDLDSLEGEATALYRQAGADVMEPPSALALARALLGPDAVVRGGTGGMAACLRDGVLRIARRVSGKRLAFSTAHELAEWWLRDRGPDERIEHHCDSLAVRLLAPAPAFREAVRCWGLELPRLADRFCLTQTAAALRLGEVLRRPVCVVSPTHFWGGVEPHQLELFARPPSRLLAGPLPSGWQRLAVTDAPRRAAIVGD